MGLDPNNITYYALLNRLLEIVLANITLANMFAVVGAIFLVATLLTHTIVPLRVANMLGCMLFVVYGALSGNVGLSSSICSCCRSMQSASVKYSIWSKGTYCDGRRYLIGIAQTVHD